MYRTRSITTFVAYSLAVMGLASGCKSEEETVESNPETSETGPVESPCGEQIDGIAITIRGLVVNGAEEGVPDAVVELEDRRRRPATILGEAVTAANGEFVLDATNITSIEDCWGILLDYNLTVESAIGDAEKQMNSWLHTSIRDESYEVDIRNFPIKVD